MFGCESWLSKSISCNQMENVSYLTENKITFELIKVQCNCTKINCNSIIICADASCINVHKNTIITWWSCLRHSFEFWSSQPTLTSFIAHICPFSLIHKIRITNVSVICPDIDIWGETKTRLWSNYDSHITSDFLLAVRANKWHFRI